MSSPTLTVIWSDNSASDIIVSKGYKGIVTVKKEQIDLKISGFPVIIKLWRKV